MSPERRTTRVASGPVLWCVLAAALFGASTPASKPLLEQVSPLFLSGVLYLGAALATAPWAFRGVAPFRAANRKNALALAGAVVFGGVLGPVLLLSGLAMTSAGSVSLWLTLETVATAVLARLFFKEHIESRTWLAVALIVLASILLSPASPGAGVAIILVALACIAWGLDNNLTSIIDHFSPAQVTFAKGAVAGSVNLTLAVVLDARSPEPWVLGAALVIGALSYGVSLLLYVAAAQHLGATRSQLIFSTAPAWGLGLSWVVLGEALGWFHVAAAALMSLAIWLWAGERHNHKHRHVRTTHRHWHRHDDGHHNHQHASGLTPATWHSHEHVHEPVEHAHVHRPDLHHRHGH